VVPGPHELSCTPALHTLELRLDDFFYRSHLSLTLLVVTSPTSGSGNRRFTPLRGISERAGEGEGVGLCESGAFQAGGGAAGHLRQEERGYARPRLGLRDGRAEPGAERPLPGGRERLDELDRLAAEMEEAQDRAARLRHRERGDDGDERQGDNRDERAAAPP